MGSFPSGFRRIHIGLLCLAFGFAGCGLSESQKPSPLLLERAPHFELKDSSGSLTRLSDWQGQVVLLDFWATWCIPCHESIPFFESLYRKYRSQRFAVLGISVDAETEYIPEFVRRYQMTYRILLDPESRVGEAYGVLALPTTLLLDRQGVIRKRWVGYDPSATLEMESEILKVLNEGPNPS